MLMMMMVSEKKREKRKEKREKTEAVSSGTTRIAMHADLSLNDGKKHHSSYSLHQPTPVVDCSVVIIVALSSVIVVVFE